MSPRRGPRSGSARGPWKRPWILVGGLLLLGLAGWIEGPRVARQVWSVVEVRRVEAHAEALRAAASESGLDPNLLAGLVYVESRGVVDAESRVGAAGLCQLMPAAASDAARRLKLAAPSQAELKRDAALNLRLGADHLRQLVRLLGPELERVLVAYNAGRGRLLEWEREAGGWAAWRARRAERGDSPTLAYAQDVLRCAERFRARGVIVPLPEPGRVDGATSTAEGTARGPNGR